MRDISPSVQHSYALPRGWTILGLGALSWGFVAVLWQVVSMLFATVAG